jgi:hypothetical protein
VQNVIRKFSHLVVVAATAVVIAPVAFANCNAKELESAGQAAAGLVRAKVETVVSVAGKEMINLSACKTKAGNFEIEYKYNFMGPEGYYWVEGEGSITPAGAGSVAFKRLSDKLKEAADAKSVSLASR